MKKTIVIAGSVSFYGTIASVRKELTALGFSVLVPHVVHEMEERGDFDESPQREKFARSSEAEKKRLVTELFEKIASADGLLIVNNEKHDMNGYIGPNVLMEMAVAVFLRKPVFLYASPSEKLPCFSEVMAIQPIVIDANASHIKKYFG